MAARKKNPPYIQIRDLKKSFSEGSETHLVLAGVDLDIQEGEFVALLGASGSGKSTLLNILSGIEPADAGQAILQGQDILSFSEDLFTLFRRSQVGFIFQFFNLLPTLNAIENVMLPLELGGTPAKEARAKAQDLLTAVGLGDRASTLPDRLSGGEQQRVAIARALVHEPSLLLADEPTGNLDEDTGAHVMQLLEELTRQRGKTMIMATHSRENAQLADQVYRLREGHLASYSLD